GSRPPRLLRWSCLFRCGLRRARGRARPPRQAEELIAADARARSLDEPIGSMDGELGTLGDLLEDPLYAAAYEAVIGMFPEQCTCVLWAVDPGQVETRPGYADRYGSVLRGLDVCSADRDRRREP